MPELTDVKHLAGTWSNEESVKRVTYDFAQDGGAVSALDVFVADNDVILTGFHAVVKTAATSGGSATVALGVTGATTAFVTETQGAVANLTANAVLLPNIVMTEGTPNVAAPSLPRLLAANSKILMTVATAALTAGKIEFVVRYMKA